MTSFLLNDGTHIPSLAFGTGTSHYGKDVSTVTHLAISTGFTHLDGAQSYGNERSLGAGINASGVPRSSLYIVTKLRQLDRGQTVRHALESSLQKLGLDHVDLFLIHNPLRHRREDDGSSNLKQIWREMEQVRSAGLTTSIGVSNCKVEHLTEICDSATIIPAVNQIELHPYVLKAAEPILAFNKAHGITTVSYAGQTPTARVPDGPVSPILERIRQRLENTLARSTPVTAGQVLIKWLLQKGIVVITTSSKESRMKESLNAVHLPDLTPEEIGAIDEAGAKLHSRHFVFDVFDDMKKLVKS